jgi:hypothetical protein
MMNNQSEPSTRLTKLEWMTGQVLSGLLANTLYTHKHSVNPLELPTERGYWELVEKAKKIAFDALKPKGDKDGS